MPEQVRKALGFLDDEEKKEHSEDYEAAVSLTPIVKSSNCMQRRPESAGKKIAKKLQFTCSDKDEAAKQRSNLFQELAKATALKNTLLIEQNAQQEKRLRLMND